MPLLCYVRYAKFAMSREALIRADLPQPTHGARKSNDRFECLDRVSGPVPNKQALESRHADALALLLPFFNRPPHLGAQTLDLGILQLDCPRWNLVRAFPLPPFRGVLVPSIRRP